MTGSGRRTLLFIGSFGYIASLGLVAWAFFTQHFAHRSGLHLRLHRRARHRPGSGDLGLHLPRFSPTAIAPKARPWAASHTGSSPPLLTTFFPKMVSAFAPGYVFLFFTCMMVLQLIWVSPMVPETKGVPLEQIQKQLGMELAPDEL